MDDNTSDEDLLSALLSPTTDRQWKQAAGLMLKRVEDQAKRTNGRVTKLELYAAMMSGGIAVVAAIVVPLFIHVVWGA